MTRVPAVCERCGAFFPSSFDISNSRHVSFRDVSVGPCPRCGGTGHIPDGTYNFIGNSIELLSGPERSRADLERLAAILRDATARHASVEEVRAKIQTDVPELRSIADALPTNRNELYAFIAIIISILTLILSEVRRGPESRIEINQVINQITQVAPPAPPGLPESETGQVPAAGRNDPCPCGSGKKYKKCHGVAR